MPPVTQATLSVAVEAARAGAAVVLGRYQQDRTHAARGPLDGVTDVDLQSEAEIIERLARAFPTHGVYAEESGWIAGGPESEYHWLVDPLCGAVNYAFGIPLFCVNVALVHVRRPVLGVMVNPLTGTWLQTGPGTGTTVTARGDPRPAEPSAASRLVALDFAEPAREGYTNETLSLALDPSFSLRFLPRSLGTSLALGYLAVGRIAGFVAYSPGDVHFAAGVVLCRGAGCVITDLNGEEWITGATGIVAAADRATHLQLMGSVRRALTGLRTIFHMEDGRP